MKIVVFGATGATGQHLVKQALDRGHLVTAFVRKPAKLRIEHPNLIVLVGDISSLPKIREAVTGQDAVLSALGATNPFRYDQELVDGFNNIIKAMKLCDVRRFVYMSTIGVSESRGQAGIIVKYIAPVLLSTEIKGHEVREKMIVNSDLGWTIVRPTTLTNGKPVRQYRSGEDIVTGKLAATISRADVADFMLCQLNTDKYLLRTPAVMY